jgi:HlyD family secretion protein
VEPAPEFDLPNWYYEKSEKIEALEAEVGAAKAYLATQLANLEKELADASNDDFVSAEKRLAEAQARFEIADLILQQAQESPDREHIEDLAQDEYDAALDDLEAAQLAYDRKLTTSASEKVLEARAQVAVARLRLDNALDALSYLQSGEDSLQVQAAEAGVDLAQTAVSQAEANLAQAQAALAVLRIQTGKSEVKAPVSGVITALNLEKGELASAGMVVLTIAQLEEVTLTVYVPENQYGLIQLGQDVAITADSFAGESFTGNVQLIADQAEFTPRNVATTDGRKATVYAVKIRIPNPGQALKPGMPADVAFSIQP